MDVAPHPAGGDDPGLAQGHQVLGKVGLPPAKGGLEVADAGFAHPKSQQDLQAGGLPDNLKKGCSSFDR